jgi:hypothetical protein
MAITVKLGDKFGVTPPSYKGGPEKIYEVIAIRLSGTPKIQIRNVRGSKKIWVPIQYLEASCVRRFKNHWDRDKE